MRPVRGSPFDDAAPVDGPSHGRTPAVQLRLDERGRFLVEASRFFPGSQREAARQVRSALIRYRGGRWHRDCAETTCPLQHRGKLTAVLWMTLKVHDHVPSLSVIRKALGVVVSHEG